MFAACEGHVEMVYELLSLGADCNYQYSCVPWVCKLSYWQKEMLTTAWSHV